MSLILFVRNYSFACGCDTVTFNDAVEWAEEIFTGHITKVEAIDTRGDHYGWRWKYTFKVNKKWKGSSESEIDIYHVGSSCDPYFDIYQSNYLIYAARYNQEELYGEPMGYNPAEGNLYAWLCSRNVMEEWENSWFDEDVKRLNKLFPEKIKLIHPLLGKIIWVLVIMMFITVLFILRVRRKRRQKRIE